MKVVRLLVLLSTVMSALARAQGAPFTGTGRLDVKGPTAPVDVGATVTLELSLDITGMTGTCIREGQPNETRPVVFGGYQADVVFDPSRLRFVSGARCPTAPDQFAGNPTFTSPSAANAAGKARILAAHSDTDGPTGSFCFARVNFVALSGGATTVSLGPESKFSSQTCPPRGPTPATNAPADIPLLPIAPLSVTVTGGGTTPPSTRLVPIVLDVVGRGGARFTSELALANRGAATATLDLSYTAATSLNASGTGKVSETLAAGEQKVIPDALAYLRGKGLQIPDPGAGGGAQGGTLAVTNTNVTADTVFAGARTTSPSGTGRAGLSYPGPLSSEAYTSKVTLYGLRENDADRSNLALVNAGTTGPITLRVTVVSGDPGNAASVALDPVTLDKGQWVQLNAVLGQAGFTNGYATVERTAGTDPFLAYAVFNDNVTNDGSFVPAVASARTAETQVVPVLVETSTFGSELVLSNPSTSPVTAELRYVESLATGSPGGTVTETLAPGEQKIIPNAIDYLRGKGATIGAKGAASYAGALFVTFRQGSALADGFAGARTGAPAAGGGQYALFYPATPLSRAARQEAYVYGLVQDAASRSNLALVNAGTGSITLRWEVLDGETRLNAGGETVTLAPGGWTQVNRVLELKGARNGFVKVTKTSGAASDAFVAYGVVNDGKDSASGTNDGAYVDTVIVQ